MRKMLTKEKCKKLLEEKGNKYSEEETDLIIEFLNSIIDSQLSITKSKFKVNETSCINGKSIK